MAKQDAAAQYDPAKVGDVTPPVISRGEGTTIPTEVLDAMIQGIDQNWRTNGMIYETDAEASNAASLFRRHVISRMNVEPKQIRSKVWSRDGKKREEKGEWIFALRQREKVS